LARRHDSPNDKRRRAIADPNAYFYCDTDAKANTAASSNASASPIGPIFLVIIDQ